jgi:hypothetical protein
MVLSVIAKASGFISIYYGPVWRCSSDVHYSYAKAAPSLFSDMRELVQMNRVYVVWSAACVTAVWLLRGGDRTSERWCPGSMSTPRKHG